jgi:hypothetical protein
MGFTNDFLAGFADLIDGIGGATWSPTGTYQDTDTGIFSQSTPPNPDGAVVLSAFSVSDDPTLADSVAGLQVMTRMGGLDPRPVNDLADTIFDALQGIHDVTLSTGVQVIECGRRSSLPLGQDDLRRWLRSDNYYVTTYRPAPHRL